MNNKFKIISLLMLSLTNHSIQSKVLIITHSYNRPDFIELQQKTFAKFLKDEYEFVVFNDAESNPDMFKKIEDTCKRCGIRCIKIPQAIHDKPYLHRWPGESNNHSCVRWCKCCTIFT